MANLVHVTPAGNARRIVRAGVSAGAYCMPVLPSYTVTHQWVRELRRWRPGVLVAVHLRLPDDEPVTVGRYNQAPESVTAARAVAVIAGQADPLGWEIVVPRAVRAAEVRRVRAVPQGIGWRHVPHAHGRRPCACPMCLQPGTPGVARLRRRYPVDGPRPTKPQLMADLRAASTSDEIIYALMSLGARSRGGAEELAYLAEHPDPEVRETLAETLESYRGRAARELRERLPSPSA